MAPGIFDEQLTTAMTVFTGLLDGGPNLDDESTDPYAVNVDYRAEDKYHAVGEATAGSFTRSTKTTPVGDELAGRVQPIWERLT